MRKVSVFSTFLVVLMALSLAIPPSFCQEVSAGITGAVTDATGGAVAQAAVTARDVDRGTTWNTTTNEQGIYFFPRVPPGNYELRIEAKGFKAAVRPGIVLESTQRARVDVSLEIGAVTESIEVTGSAPLLQTDRTEVGGVITTNRLTNSPMISRNYIILTLLNPGVTTTNPAAFNNDQRTTGGGRPYVNGNRKEANNFLLDGIDNNQVSDNLTSYQPNLDAISEVRMITNNASAEFGNFQGGIINVLMKSGTNDLHGSLFHFWRNDKLNANNWARNWNNLPRSYVRYNSFGGTVGGPLTIPKLFDGRDRLFFFADYMGMRRPTPATIQTITVAPAGFRQGDFSRLLTEQNRQLYNPFDLDANGRRRPFANNQIPMSMMSPVARALYGDQSLYPLPLNSDLRLNQTNASSSQLNLDQGDVKVDAKLS
ncbi:MAG: carboxypeptidase regulatory-like domain-containing protein, partial [Bryobacteraceae bacterium]|nr:carboxypeptidase regulatory-like domain-containing protein [Bryobacteraceae bacterium]